MKHHFLEFSWVDFSQKLLTFSQIFPFQIGSILWNFTMNNSPEQSRKWSNNFHARFYFWVILGLKTKFQRLSPTTSNSEDGFPQINLQFIYFHVCVYHMVDMPLFDMYQNSEVHETCLFYDTN